MMRIEPRLARYRANTISTVLLTQPLELTILVRISKNSSVQIENWVSNRSTLWKQNSEQSIVVFHTSLQRTRLSLEARLVMPFSQHREDTLNLLSDSLIHKKKKKWDKRVDENSIISEAVMIDSLTYKHWKSNTRGVLLGCNWGWTQRWHWTLAKGSSVLQSPRPVHVSRMWYK